MTYAVHLCEARPAPDDPDYPPGCVSAPAGYERLGYLAWHATAEARTKRGERQVRCLTCDRYRWETTPCTEPTTRSK